MKIIRQEWTKRMFQEDLDGRLRSKPNSDENLRTAQLNPDLEILVRHIEDVAKQEEAAITYAILDVDRMTEINKKYGETIGDMILSEIRAVTEYVLKEKKAGVYKPKNENQFTHGDQLFIILNYAGINAEEDLQEVLREIEATVATRVYGKLVDSIKANPDRIPARWEELKQEGIKVSIGGKPLGDIRSFYRSEGPCTLATLLNGFAVQCLGTVKKLGGYKVFCPN